MNIAGTIDGARRAFELVGRGCLVKLEEDEDPRYATMAELASRLGPDDDMLLLLAAVSEAVEKYDPQLEAVILLESGAGFDVLILTPQGYHTVGGLELLPDWTRT